MAETVMLFDGNKRKPFQLRMDHPDQKFINGTGPFSTKPVLPRATFPSNDSNQNFVLTFWLYVLGT